MKLNANQKKFYNAQHEFFTKSLGPGHYEPSVELTKPKRNGTGWGSTRVKREKLGEVRNVNHPGPGEYAY